MKPIISVFIPVYKKPKQLQSILDALIRDGYKRKQIFVIFDGPCTDQEKIIKKFKKQVIFVINKQNKGKVYSINKAVKLSSGDILLFLDNDVEIEQTGGFLEKVITEIKEADILDLKKEVVKSSFLAKMTFYEYAGFNIGSWILTKFVQRCPTLNGSAWAIKRKKFKALAGLKKVVCEDLDIATRAFLKNYKFKYTKEAVVHNYVPSNWNQWFAQRKRWTIGQALWFKKWYKYLLKKCIKAPQIFIPVLFFLFPALIFLILSFSLPEFLFYKAFSLIVLFLTIKFSLAFPILILTTLGVNVFKNLFLMILSFLIYSCLFFIFSKKLEFEFKIYEFLPYYFFYSFLTLLLSVSGLIQVFIFNKKSVLYWKV